MVDNDILRFINIGNGLVFKKDKGYIFGGKSAEAKQGLTQIKYDNMNQVLQF